MPALSRLERPLEDWSYPISRGVGVNITVTARCTCGWAGQPHRWEPTSTADLDADIDDHRRSSGHPRAADSTGADLDASWHHRCGYVHQTHDDFTSRLPGTNPSADSRQARRRSRQARRRPSPRRVGRRTAH